LGTVFATDFNGLAGDGDLDGVVVEGIVARGASSSCHDLFLLTRGSGKDSRPWKLVAGLSQSLEKWSLATESGAPEGGGGTSVSTTKGSGEVAVAGEADLEGESGEVVVVRKKVEGAGEAEAELIPIEGHALNLLKDLGEVNGRAMDFGGYLGEGPTASEVGGEEELDAIDDALIAEATAWSAGGAWSEGALDEGEREAFCFEGFGRFFAEAVAEHGHEGLGACVNTKSMGAEGGR
jgi:hypothetical protein